MGGVDAEREHSFLTPGGELVLFEVVEYGLNTCPGQDSGILGPEAELAWRVEDVDGVDADDDLAGPLVQALDINTECAVVRLLGFVVQDVGTTLVP